MKRFSFVLILAAAGLLAFPDRAHAADAAADETWYLTKATVVAINRDWGIIFVDGGKNDGIKHATDAFVLRGKKRVAGSFRIVHLEDENAVLEFKPSPTAPDEKIRLRDQVYFELSSHR